MLDSGPGLEPRRKLRIVVPNFKRMWSLDCDASHDRIPRASSTSSWALEAHLGSAPMQDSSVICHANSLSSNGTLPVTNAFPEHLMEYRKGDPMTHVLGILTVDDPCARCGSRRIWLMKYHSLGFDRYVCLCETCGGTLVVEPKRTLLAKAGGWRNFGTSRRHFDHQE
jgi:hypothetical protein